MIADRPPDVNDAQWQAISHAGGHLLIVAGPGTGKTHTLTRRIVHLSGQLESGQQILAITFTTKAAEEMAARLKGLAADGKNIFVGTFHRFCLTYLRAQGVQTGLPEHFCIASDNDLQSLSVQIWPDATKKERKEKLEAVARWKGREANEKTSQDVERYNQVLRRNGLLDYDDLLIEALRVLRRDSARRYVFVCLDEYQDLNALQHAFLKELVAKGAILTAIGDPQQAIYGFRGAGPEFFAQFTTDFNPAQVVSLSENYRAAPNLLEACGQVMAVAQPFPVTGLTARIYQEGKLTVHEAASDRAEAEYVVHQIERMVGGTSMFSHDSARVAATQQAQRSFQDIAVLYRLNAQKNILEEALARQGIPYQVSGDRPLRDAAPIPALVALLKACHEGSLAEALNRVRQSAAGKKIFEDLRPAWQNNCVRFLRIAARFDRLEAFLDELMLEQPEDAFEYHAEKVHILTMHAAKGLEFPVVFILGCEEGLLPLDLGTRQADPDEERRLLYVGMTRAKEALWLTYARKRRILGHSFCGRASKFLRDIENRLKAYDAPRQGQATSSGGRPVQMELFSGAPAKNKMPTAGN